MNQSKEYLKYRKRYDQIAEAIKKLSAEQIKVRKMMEKYCNHSNLELVEYSPFEIQFGIADEEGIRYKCRDCWRYFDLKEIKELHLDTTSVFTNP